LSLWRIVGSVNAGVDKRELGLNARFLMIKGAAWLEGKWIKVAFSPEPSTGSSFWGEVAARRGVEPLFSG
jgi:hypothetical protein